MHVLAIVINTTGWMTSVQQAIDLPRFDPNRLQVWVYARGGLPSPCARVLVGVRACVCVCVCARARVV